MPLDAAKHIYAVVAEDTAAERQAADSIGLTHRAISGILTKNVPLIVSNVLCLCVMAVELVRNKKKK